MPEDAAAAAVDAGSSSGGSPANAVNDAPLTGDNVTTRGWDGWPTPPTPDYLIPGMGKIPVSSTIHFQSVALTSMGEGITSAEMWSKLRKPLLAAASRRNEDDDPRRVVINSAGYGDWRPPVSVDLTEKINALMQNGRLPVELPPELFADNSPDRVKLLTITFTMDGVPGFSGGFTITGTSGTFGGRTFPDVQVTYAIYHDDHSGAVSDVTQSILALVSDGRLDITVHPETFGLPPGPEAGRNLVLDFTVNGIGNSITFLRGARLSLPGMLRLANANYSTAGAIDVTGGLVAKIASGQMSIDVSTATFGWDPDPAIAKSLRVGYTRNGIPFSQEFFDGETFRIGRASIPANANALFDRYFKSAPASVAGLARSLTNDGWQPTDFNSSAAFSSMEDELNTLLGFAPEERLDPLASEAGAIDTPAEGVILYHEQGWYGRGLALGNLLHSVALAPGEITQVAMTHWNHATRASDSETVSQQDATAESDSQNRSVAEIQDSSLREHTSGGSSAESQSDSSSFGRSSVEVEGHLGFMSAKGSISGVSASSGSVHTVSTAVAHSEGGKNLTMDSNQNINAITQRHSEAARTRRASVVREVTQSEDENLTTRVVANYNHMHALTMMYFEVIEVFNLKTRVVDAERLIFLPFVVHNIKELIPRFSAVLIDAANRSGRPELALAVQYAADANAANKRINQIAAERAEAETRLKGLDADYANLFKDGGKLSELSAEKTRLAARVKAINDERHVLLKAMDVSAAMPPMLARLVTSAFQAQLQPLAAEIEQIAAKTQAISQTESRVREQMETERAAALRQCRILDALLRQSNEAVLTSDAVNAETPAGPLEDNRLFFNQAVWLSLSPGEVLSLARRRQTFKGEMICEQIDPAPVAVSGNMVGYRWRFDDAVRGQLFKKKYVEPYIGDPELELATSQADIAVPTGGVFGEAVLGRGVSAEKIDLSRFWNWKDSMIPILPTSINPLSAVAPTMQNLSAEPGKLDESSAKLGQLQDLPAPSGFGALAQTMQAQIFRDMSGQAMLQALQEATTKAAASGDQNAAKIASENLKAGLNFISDMSAKAMSLAAAPETGGASLLGGMVKSKDSGGASLLGGVLNAQGAGGNGDLLTKLAGGKGDLMNKAEAPGGAGAAGSSGGSQDGTTQRDGSRQKFMLPPVADASQQFSINPSKGTNTDFGSPDTTKPFVVTPRKT